MTKKRKFDSHTENTAVTAEKREKFEKSKHNNADSESNDLSRLICNNCNERGHRRSSCPDPKGNCLTRLNNHRKSHGNKANFKKKSKNKV